MSNDAAPAACEIKMDEVMAEIEAALAAEAAKPRPKLSKRERQAFNALYEEFSCLDYSNKRKGVRGLPIRKLATMWSLLKLPCTDEEIEAFVRGLGAPAGEKPPAPRLLTFDEMIDFRESQIKNRTKRDKLRQAFVTLSTDGRRIDFDELVGYITLGGQRSRDEAERIALFAAFPDDPPLARPPGDLWVSVDACVDLYFAVRAKAENAGPPPDS